MILSRFVKSIVLWTVIKRQDHWDHLPSVVVGFDFLVVIIFVIGFAFAVVFLVVVTEKKKDMFKFLLISIGIIDFNSMTWLSQSYTTFLVCCDIFTSTSRWWNWTSCKSQNTSHYQSKNDQWSSASTRCNSKITRSIDEISSNTIHTVLLME